MGKNKKCIVCGNIIVPFINDIYDTRFGIKGKFDIYKCTSCGLIQTLPLLSKTSLKELYERYYNFRGESHQRYTKFREKILFSFFYKMWLYLDADISFHRRKGTGLLLDIGCNEGRGMRIYRNNGFTVEGVELNENAANIARSYGFKVYSVDIAEISLKNKYDVVVLSNVLEHCNNPVDILQIVNRLLKPEAEVWISCPNVNSWARYVFGKKWINWHVPFHLVHFSSSTLRKILEKTGFYDIKIYTRTPAMWIAHSLITTIFARYGKKTFYLRSIFLVGTLTLFIRLVFFPFLLLMDLIGKGDCLIVSAKKQK